jgi:hypothetical protein
MRTAEGTTEVTSGKAATEVRTAKAAAHMAVKAAHMAAKATAHVPPATAATMRPRLSSGCSCECDACDQNNHDLA